MFIPVLNHCTTIICYFNLRKSYNDTQVSTVGKLNKLEKIYLPNDLPNPFTKWISFSVRKGVFIKARGQDLWAERATLWLWGVIILLLSGGSRDKGSF